MISSFRNPLVKQIKRLRRRKHRLREGLFFVEGLRATLTAVEQNAPIAALVYAPDLLTSVAAQEAISQAEARGVRCEAVTAELFASISERENPTGLAAVVERQVRGIGSLPVRPMGFFVALVEVADPGNVGTILRTADAVGADGVILVGQTTDAEHPTAVKASMGTCFTVPIAQATAEELWAWVAREKLGSVATSAHATQTLWEANYAQQMPLVLLMGSEQFGLSDEMMGQAAQCVAIPMQGQATSLNLGIATSLLLYEIRRQSNG